MARDLARRIGALENGNGTIGLGDLLDTVDDMTINHSDPRTWPAGWVGKAINPAVLRALDEMPDPNYTRPSPEEVQQRLADLPL